MIFVQKKLLRNLQIKNLARNFCHFNRDIGRRGKKFSLLKFFLHLTETEQ